MIQDVGEEVPQDQAQKKLTQIEAQEESPEEETEIRNPRGEEVVGQLVERNETLEDGIENRKCVEVRQRLEDCETVENKATEIAVLVIEKDLEVDLSGVIKKEVDVIPGHLCWMMKKGI